MTDKKNDIVWITIPDEATPALEAPVSEQQPVVNSSDKVKNKAFWGAGFVALLVFTAVLLAPQELAGLMKAQLFDGQFQVVPDFEEQQQQGTLFGEGEGEGEEFGDSGDESTESSSEDSAIQAESEAVSIQIDPLEGSEDAADSAGEGEASSDSEGSVPATDAESISLDDSDADGSGAVGADADAETDSSADLNLDANVLQALSKQLEDFKEKERRNEQLIQDLMQLIQDQNNGLRPSAGNQGATSPLGPGQLPGQQAANNQFGQQPATSPGVYRYNTHTVTISPYDVLAQNQGAQQAAYQANLAGAQVQTPTPSFSPQLAGAPAQPATGPAETLILALFLASLGVLLWGSMRALRA